MLTSPKVPVITKAQLLEAVRILGLDAGSVQSLTMHRSYIEVVLAVVNDQGKVVAAGNELATAVIKIPVVDNQFEAQTPAVTPNGDQIAVDAGVA